MGPTTPAYARIHEKQPLVLRLESWLLASSEAIIFTFLTQLSASLGKKQKDPNKAKEVAKKIQQFSQLLNPFKLMPVAEPCFQSSKSH